VYGRNRHGTDDDGAPDGNERSTRVAFLGNSILYFNDCPRLLQHMMGSDSMIQESCLRGGASLSSLWNKGNGMRNMFRCPNSRIVRNRKNKENSNSDDEEEEYEYDIGAPTVKELLSDERGWDFVVMNDYTQGPARTTTRQESVQVLEQKYAPLLKTCDCVPVFLQTAAYRLESTKGAEDLGSTRNFT